VCCWQRRYINHYKQGTYFNIARMALDEMGCVSFTLLPYLRRGWCVLQPTYWLRGWVGHRVGLDVVGLSRESNTAHSAHVVIFVNFVGWDYVSELQLPSCLFFILQMLYGNGEPLWNETSRRKLKSWEKNLPLCHFVHHKSHMDWQEREPGPPRWEADD
jgi:hypothetical protein